MASSSSGPLSTVGLLLMRREPCSGAAPWWRSGSWSPTRCTRRAGGGSSPLVVNTKILEKLVRQLDTSTIGPELARSWQFSEDGREVHFALQENARWHDGTPFTSADVEFTIMRVMRRFGSSRTMKSLVGVDTPDPHTAVVRFSEPAAEFMVLALFATSQSSILPSHIYQGTDLHKNPANNAPIGTGPFRLVEWDRGSHVELVRNEDYWDEGKPYLDRLIIRYIRDPGARAAAMEAGEVQLALSNPFPPPEVRRIGNLPGFVADTGGYETAKWQMMLEMNVREGILAKRDVRRAIAHAIDKRFIAETIYYGFARPSVGPVPIDQTKFHLVDLEGYAYDPAAAVALLDAAGYPVRRDGTRLSLRLIVTPWFTENIKTGHYLRQALGDVGIEIELITPDRAGAIRRIYSDYDFDLSISNAIHSGDPLISTTPWYTTSGIVKGAAFRNASGFSHLEVDEVVDLAAVETDEAKRIELIHQFQRLAIENVPILPLVDIDMANVVSTRLHNYSYTSQWMFDSWKDLWIEPE